MKNVQLTPPSPEKKKNMNDAVFSKKPKIIATSLLSQFILGLFQPVSGKDCHKKEKDVLKVLK